MNTALKQKQSDMEKEEMVFVLKTALDANRDMGDKKLVFWILSLIIKLFRGTTKQAA